MTPAPLIRLHVTAAVASGAVAAALFALAVLQLLVPGVFHDAPALGYGRLVIALLAATLLGLVGNMFFMSLYEALPRVADAAARRHAGFWVFGLWNIAITIPAVFAALAGVLPQNGAIGLLMESPSARFSMVGLLLWAFAGRLGKRQTGAVRTTRFSLLVLLVMLTSLAITIAQNRTEWPGTGPRLGVRVLDIIATHHTAWVVQLVGAIVVLVCCVVWLHALLTPRSTVSVANALPDGRRSRAFTWFWVAIIAFWPLALVMDARSNDLPPAATTPSEARGRATYVREGCGSCHNVDRQSIGPDLSHESGVRRDDWHYTHLFMPALVTPTSVMPSYAQLFDGAPDKPTLEARDLVAYLNAMGRERVLGMSDDAAAAVHPTRTRRRGDIPDLPETTAVGEGQRLFATYCFGCHGATGEGDGPAAASLRPRPANLTAHRYAKDQLAYTLWNGVAGTAMPAWRDMRLDRMAALVAYVGSLSRTDGSTEAALVASGATVYAAHCSQCHGDAGGGNGFSADALPVAPVNFQRQQPSLDYALRVIAGGVEGTPMAPWTSRINEQELLAVAHYVRSLYRGDAR